MNSRNVSNSRSIASLLYIAASATTLAGLASLVVLAAGCSDPEPDEALDPIDEAALSPDGKTDVAGLTEGSARACRVLKLVRTADLETLDVDAKLNARAAAEIIEAREGKDATLNTGDDAFFANLAELDAVPYVGVAAFKALAKYADAHVAYKCTNVAVQLLAFNDFHGNLKPPAGSSGRIVNGPDPLVNRVDAGGVEFMATFISNLRAQNPNTVVVTAGDIIGATPLLSALFHDEPTIEAMNLIGLDVAGVGNHEFDEGLAELERMQFGGCHPADGCKDGDDFAGASFEYLAANVTDDTTGETIFPGVTFRRFGGTQVAFVGMTLEGTPAVTTAAGTVGLSFHDEADTVNAMVPELKKRGVKSSVVLIHEGGPAPGLYNQSVAIAGPLFEIVSRLDPEIDVVVAGHTNAAHICDLDGRLVTSAASFGRLVTDIDLTIDERTGNVVTKRGENVIVTRDVAKDPALSALIARYEVFAAPLANRVVGTQSGDLVKLQNSAGESPLGDVIADSMLEAMRGVGGQIAFMNPGGVRTDLIAATVSGGEAAGQVTYGELFAVQPFGNTLAMVTLSGAQLEALLEQQWQLSNGVEKANVLAPSAGFSYVWDATRPLGDRVDPASIKLDGVPVNPNDKYRVVVNNFLADGGDGFGVLRSGTQREAGPVDIDAMEAYFVAHAPIVAPPSNRIGQP